MLSKTLAFCTFLAAVSAHALHGHGHAVSTQNIIRHDVPLHHGIHNAHLGHYGAGLNHYGAYLGHYGAGLNLYGTNLGHYGAHLGHYAAPIAHHGSHHGHYDGHDTYAHPKYDYSYSVSDPHTGDHKSQHESRDGDVVHGSYSLAQSDGTIRKVDYTAGHDGFNAVVHNSGVSHHPHTYGHGHAYGLGHGLTHGYHY